MKHFLFLIFIFTLSSCGLLRRSAVPHVERYVIFYTDSFEIYYNIDTLIHYCEEMRNPQSVLYNEFFTKNSVADVCLLRSITHDIKYNVESYSGMTSFDANKSKSEYLRDIYVFGAVKDVEYLFYKEKTVKIKSHYSDSIYVDYVVDTIRCDVGDFADVYDKKKNRLLYGFKWLYWWENEALNQFE